MTADSTPQDLDALLAAGSRAVVRDTSGGGVLLTTSDARAMADLRVALRVEAVQDGFCMCWGDYDVDVLDHTGRRITTVSHHHASTLRWDGFDGDGELADGEALLHWLADRDCPEPLARFRERARRNL
jgi:hypothetical protein